jgi:DNA-binding NtrC family response regulator
VEDQAELRRLATAVLTQQGYIVREASCALEALIWFERDQNRFDLVFTDYGLPDMDAPQMLAKMRAATPSLSILLTSGTPRLLPASLVSDGACTAFLPKPYAFSTMLNAVAELIAWPLHGSFHPMSDVGRHSA